MLNSAFIEAMTASLRTVDGFLAVGLLVGIYLVLAYVLIEQEQEQDTTGATISRRPPSQIQPFLYFYIDNNPVFIRYTDCLKCRNMRSLCSMPYSVYCSHCRQNIHGRCHWSPLGIVYQIVRCRQCFWSIDHPFVGIDTVAGDVVDKVRRKTKR